MVGRERRVRFKCCGTQNTQLESYRSDRSFIPVRPVRERDVTAALIASRDQGSVVLAFTLVLLVLKHFLWRVVLVISMFVAWLLVDLLCFIAVTPGL